MTTPTPKLHHLTVLSSSAPIGFLSYDGERYWKTQTQYLLAGIAEHYLRQGNEKALLMLSKLMVLTTVLRDKERLHELFHYEAPSSEKSLITIPAPYAKTTGEDCFGASVVRTVLQANIDSFEKILSTEKEAIDELYKAYVPIGSKALVTVALKAVEAGVCFSYTQGFHLVAYEDSPVSMLTAVLMHAKEAYTAALGTIREKVLCPTAVQRGKGFYTDESLEFLSMAYEAALANLSCSWEVHDVSCINVSTEQSTHAASDAMRDAIASQQVVQLYTKLTELLEDRAEKLL